MNADRETVNAPGAPPAIGPYSHAVIVDPRSAGGLLFCSGQIPLDPATGELVGGTAAEQARRCLENLRAVCEAAVSPTSSPVAGSSGIWPEQNRRPPADGRSTSTAWL